MLGLIGLVLNMVFLVNICCVLAFGYGANMLVLFFFLQLLQLCWGFGSILWCFVMFCLSLFG